MHEDVQQQHDSPFPRSNMLELIFLKLFSFPMYSLTIDQHKAPVKYNLAVSTILNFIHLPPPLKLKTLTAAI